MINSFRLVFAAARVCLFIVAWPAASWAQQAVACVNCSTIATQLIQQANQITQMQTEFQSYVTQTQQLLNMTQNTVNIPNQIYSTAMADMNKVNALLTQGSQLSANDTGSSMGTFSSYLSSYPAFSGALTGQMQQYTTWSQRTKDAIVAAMNAVQLQTLQMSTDDATMQGLQSQSMANNGQMQAIQNVAQLVAQGVRETEKLRQLIMVQIQLETNKQQNQSEQQSAAAAAQSAFSNVPAVPLNGKTYQ